MDNKRAGKNVSQPQDYKAFIPNPLPPKPPLSLIFRYQDKGKISENKSVASPFVLSPMASLTSWPLRILCQRYGAGCTIGEMAKPEYIVRQPGSSRNRQLLARHPDERFTGVQLVGADPFQMQEAAKIVADMGFDFIDLNAACPARRIRKHGAGGALLENPDRIAPLLRALAKGGLPVTIKLRSGSKQTPRAALEALKIADDCGVSAIWFHARSIHNSYDCGRKPDHNFSSEVVASAVAPVFVGGGIETASEAVRVLRETGAAGVLIARGAIGNPFIFRDAMALLNGSKTTPVPLGEVLSVMLEHFNGISTLMGENKACHLMRTLFQHYLGAEKAFEPFVEKGKKAATSRQVYEIIEDMNGGNGGHPLYASQ
jgi:tRNA-dihydrouridine synthase B